MSCECTGCAQCLPSKSAHESTCSWPWGRKPWQKRQRRCHWCADRQRRDNEEAWLWWRPRPGSGTATTMVPTEPPLPPPPPPPPAEPTLRRHGNGNGANGRATVTKTPMSLQMVLQQGGDFLWNGSSDQRFHVQTQNAVSSSGSPLVAIWLSGSGGHKELAVSHGQIGPTATAIRDSAILVSPYSRLKYKADVPDWIVKLTAALTQEVGGRLVLVGFSRGAKWCHEILRQLISMSVTMPLRCLLVAPYCAARFNVHEQREHASSIKGGLTTVRSICTMQDMCCPWQKYGDFIKEMGEWRDVSGVFPMHEDTLSGLLSPKSSDVVLDVQWLLGRRSQSLEEC